MHGPFLLGCLILFSLVPLCINVIDLMCLKINENVTQICRQYLQRQNTHP
uniref:Uncharacterized protein n=1 Tax=Arundo donax TaxID=35708 RepID=A0A0A9G2J0_ARUDO